MNTATIHNATANNNDVLANIALDLIIPFSLGNSRSKRDSKKFAELKSSVESQGVVQPILLRPASVDGLYELVAGNGRHQASVELGKADIPALIREMSDEAAYEAHLSENTNREDLGIVDEAKAAGKWFAFFEGDKQAAADRLGWTMKKMTERLELLRCSTLLLDALEAGQIKPAHAMILTSFSENLQIGTLKKIIDENWSVKYLKERAGKAQKYISTAKFDTTGCNGCPHNSEGQAGLFDAVSERAKCSNIACFKEKTSAWLDQQQSLATEQYGKVLKLVDVPAENRDTVDSSIVGLDQFDSGCTGCESNIVLIDDRSGREGALVRNQCLDKVCFANCVKKHNEPVVETKESKPSIAPANVQSCSAASASVSVTAKKTSPKKTTPVQKTNKKIVEQSRNDLRSVAASTLLNDSSFKQGLVLSLLCQKSGYKPQIDSLKAHRSNDFIKNVAGCVGADFDALQKEIINAMVHLCTTAENNDGNTDKQFTDLMLASFAQTESFKEKAIAAWKPTKDILSNFTKEQLSMICNDSGFTAAYDQKNKAGAFKVYCWQG